MNAGADFSSSTGLEPISTGTTSHSPSPLPDWTPFIQLEQTFQLLADSPLTVEVCLYHQVLPLAIEENRVKVGMVDPSDGDALMYVQTLLGYLNFTLVSGRISLQAHKDTLSAYLKYREESISNPSPHAPVAPSAPTKRSGAAINLAPAIGASSYPQLPQGRPEVELNARETVYTDETTVAHDETVVIYMPSQDQEQLPPTRDALHTIDPPGIPKTEDQRTTERSFPLDNPTPTLFQAPSAQMAMIAQSALPLATAPQRQGTLPLRLDIQPTYINHPIQVLETLPPKVVLEELLARVLSGGIGRLFFERTVTHGRVIWSQNGIIKAELESLTPQVFNEVIQRLKFMHNVPVEPVTQTVRVEIERFYDQQRLLLRLQIMPGLYGEEANLQILRGVALQFYQQRQLASVSRDAMNVTQQLQNKLNEIYELAVANNIPEKTQIEMLSTLSKVVNTMDEQLKALDTLSGEE